MKLLDKKSFFSPWIEHTVKQDSKHIMYELYSHSFSRCPSHQYVLVICLHIQLWFSVVHQLQIIDDHKSTLKQNKVSIVKQSTKFSNTEAS